MAKRFTDTGKWDKAWFRKLSPLMKTTWGFLCDRCDHAGVWEIDTDALEFFVGEAVQLDALLSTFGDRLKQIGNKILIDGFAEFQYGHLNPCNRVHKSVLDRLERLAPNKPLKSPLKGAQDTDTDKDKDADKEKEDRLKEQFNEFEQYYRNQFLGTTTGQNAWKRFGDQFRNKPDDIPDLFDSVQNYILLLKKSDWRKPKTSVETFLGTKSSGYFWRDFIEATANHSEAGSMRGV